MGLLNWYATQQEIDTQSRSTVRAGDILYRARIYACEKDIEEKESDFHGYGPKASFVPPEGVVVSSGRANPKGIRYLYCATDIETAISEVVPLMEDEVSVAEILVEDNLKILDFCAMYASSTGLDTHIIEWRRNVPIEFTRIFNKPYRDSDDYILCQYICEYVKKLGYDGIKFASSKVNSDWEKESGFNYTIFNFKDCKPVASNRFYVYNVDIKLKKYNSKCGMFEYYEG